MEKVLTPPTLGALLDWSGETVVCVASGPSLTQRDVDLLKHLKVITVNNSWQMHPNAEVHYAGDLRWWKRYPCRARGERWSCSKDACIQFGLKYHRALGPYGSGYRAVQLALLFNPAKILLLGYDNSLTQGVHWHGPHVTPGGGRMLNPTPSQCRKWQQHFMELQDPRIVNVSRQSAIDAYPREPVENYASFLPRFRT